MKSPALLIIDVQKGLDDPSLGRRNNPKAESNIALLLSAWRKREWPVVHVQHDSVSSNSALRPGLPGNAVKPEAEPLPGEKQFRKSVNSAFIGTGLEEYLRQHDISSLTVVGLTTEHCISSSVRMAANLGFDVTLVSDATAAFERVGYDGVTYSAEEVHRINLVSLDGEFCAIRTAAKVLKDIA